ncbi:PstS family phosphate ABC transporter substrate-binding protein [Jeotgalibacillus sp. R-1-5s-1]|uniref:PstS family phosphate ABC transporter substrate-binding protein n=1 Tax=Jeotgalibacillus sp. R-1-5s-1 TaxID=2555897 RepID=UPI00106A4257|nr:PstS family phosphate ABC transporter substrate-binding protein [Jeotgalibacillus sp. R-1-5s-1]TFD92297.1 PstS family phosphate ABC transporter substrate-binding protein [Jeotgalibacillus sp. R-1-5s-1]
MKSVKYLAMSTILGSAVFLAACGEEEAADSSNGSGSESSELEGQVRGDGSSTVAPIMEAIVEEYAAAQPGVQVSSGVSGTGGGFEKFIAGETAFSNASREISEEEIAGLEEAGIEFTEVELAFDGLSVVVSQENDWVDYLTVEELKEMWTETGEEKTWADIREGWPEEPIEYYSPGTDSGTYDYFNEVILEDQDIVRSATLSEDDNVLVQGVLGSPNAVGYFGYAYYLENQDTLRAVPIDNGEGPVEPNNETIESGEYAPLSRPMFTYVSNAAIAEDPAAADFIKFAIENAGDLSEAVGYVRAPQDVYDEDMATIEELAGE